jgi:hypothetical protein
MKSAIYGIAFILVTFGVFSMAAFHHAEKSFAKQTHEADKISGDWEAKLEAFGTITQVKLNLKLDGEKVTGTVESGHTGAGTIGNGSWKDNKLEFIANFAKHESISFKGDLKNDKITGEYATEGRISRWEATRKNPATKNGETANLSHKATSEDVISGEWSALLVSQDTSAPVTLKLKLEGHKITGTGESDHLGTGTIENGIWADNKISFKLKVAQVTISINGVLKDGKLIGEFNTEQMTGKWEARKK